MYPLTALFVPADPNAETKIVTLNEWRDIQRLINGTFDCVPAFPIRPGTNEDSPVDCWVNDEGLIFNMPINDRITWLTRRRLVGDVVVTGEPTADGESTDVPDWLKPLMDKWYDAYLLWRASDDLR